MEEPEQRIECAIQIRPESVMTGFCYAFTHTLLQKLKKLNEEDKIFITDDKIAQMAPIVDGIICHLRSQLHFTLPLEFFGSHCQPLEHKEKREQIVNETIAVVEDFLEIFEVPGEQLPVTEGPSLKKATRKLEITLIKKALEKTNGNRSEAAKLLEISQRALLYKMKDYGIEQ